VVNSASRHYRFAHPGAKAKADALVTPAPATAPPCHRGRLFNQVAGMQLQEIPYKGTMPAITDLVGGQVP
jgi:tripartite-type tricarboxylate transporter receptor subunit TctC